MNNVSENWKNSEVFKKQLELNLKELSSSDSFPMHWESFIELMEKNKPASMLDVGCGCGAIYELCRKKFPDMEYHGVDYAESAINLANKTWGEHFSVKDYKELDEEYVSKFDLVHMNGLLDILPNGDEALEYILSLSPKNIIIVRMRWTDKESYYDTYEAYDKITTCAYFHNRDNFKRLCEKYGYEFHYIREEYYLKKKQ